MILLRDQETKSWKTSSQNSILFEIDGPYKVTNNGETVTLTLSGDSCKLQWFGVKIK